MSVGKQRRRLRFRLGALDRDQRQIVANGNFKAVRFSLFGDPGEVFFAGSGVNNEAEIIFRKEIDNQVVDDAGGGGQHAGVERFAWGGELRHIVGQQIAQELADPAAVEIDDGHMRHIEHPCIAAHRMVLINLGPVMQRHHPAMEIHHARAAQRVLFIQRSLLSHLFLIE